MRRPRPGLAVVLTLATILAAPAAAASTSQTAGPRSGAQRIESGLLAKLESKAVDRFVVEFKAEADLQPTSARETWAARGRRVHHELVETAEQSQAGVAAEIAKTPGATAETLWIANEMLVEHGTAQLARRIASRPEVATVRSEVVVEMIEPVDTAAGEPSVVSTPWGVAAVRAPEAWTRGITGQGVVVGLIDTGVRYTHTALAAQYRGGNGDGSYSHDYNWFDPSAACTAAPCDTQGHGTHVTGTMVGGDGEGPGIHDVGVAPGARWIAARGCAVGTSCAESDLLASGQFMLAPTTVNGTNPDPARRPHIVNNSWGGSDTDRWYDATAAAWRAAGIIGVFSAGNSGPSCNTTGNPANGPDAFAVAAYASNGALASFSSRGGTTFTGKPDVAAPGVGVESASRGSDTSYSSKSGTSMAAPHVVGVLALLLSAEPALPRDVDHATQVLRHTATDVPSTLCSSAQADPNHEWGDGKIDAVAALDLLQTHGTLTVRTVDPGGAPVAATLRARQTAAPQRSFQQASTGQFGLYLPAGTYDVTATSPGQPGSPPTATATVLNGTDTIVTLTFMPDPGLTGVVRRADTNQPLAGATVRATSTTDSTVSRTASTAADGSYRLILGPGTYSVVVTAAGFQASAPAIVTVAHGPDTVLPDTMLNATVDAERALIGFVRDAGTGVGVAGANVQAAPAGGGSATTAPTAADGSYVLPLAAGPYTVTVSAGSCSTARSATVTIADSDLTQDFAVGPIASETKNKYRCVSIPYTYPLASSMLTPSSPAPVALALPFRFKYYGGRYPNVFVSSDGWLAFQKPGSPEAGNTLSVPSTNDPNRAIYPAANRYTVGTSPAGTGAMFYGPGPTTAGVRSFVVEWRNVADPSGGRNTFQVTLWENGSFDLRYETMAANNRPAAGFELDRTSYLAITNRTTALPGGVAIRFEPTT